MNNKLDNRGIMRAIVSNRAGGPDTLETLDLPKPQAGVGQLLVKMRACSINYPDLLMIQDKYQTRIDRPFVPGMEIAGIVVAVGPGVEGFNPGDRIASAVVNGGLAEFVVVCSCDALKMPDNMGFAEGAALIICHGTAIYGLGTIGRLQPGETLLVTGASGGLGRAAVELGRAMGARVVAAVSSDYKGEIARAAGAHEVVVYPLTPLSKVAAKTLTDTFKGACGGVGANVIFDVAGGDYSEPAIRAIAIGGRFLVVGFAAGIAQIPLNLPLLKECSISGVYWGNFRMRNPTADRASMEKLTCLFEEGKIRPFISESFAFDDAIKSFRPFTDRTVVGKVVVTSGAD